MIMRCKLIMMSGLDAKSQSMYEAKSVVYCSCYHDQVAIINDEVKLVVSEMQVHWQWARECLCYQGKRNHLLQTHAQAWEVEDSGHMRISDQKVK